jgi:predicted NUDIX family NTP pyrophosphohydrolase
VAAKREFAEEMGAIAASADYIQLGTFRQPSGKAIGVITAESDCEPERIVNNTVSLEWPKESGTIRSYPEFRQRPMDQRARSSHLARGFHEGGACRACLSDERCF